MTKIPRRKFGSTDAEVSILGLGGGGTGLNPQIRGSHERPQVRELAIRIINKALDAGVNYFDSCNGYGESESILGEVAATRRDEMFLATKCRFPGVADDELRRELEQSLTRMQTDRLDLWQIHNLTKPEDVDAIFQKGHAIETFVKAKEEGLARFIGVTSHTSATFVEGVMERCEREGIEMDAMLFSFSVADAAHGGHGKRLLERYPDVAKVAMKALGSDRSPIVSSYGVDADTALRYAMSHDFATTIVGMHTLRDADEDLNTAANFRPMDDDARRQVEKQIAAPGANVFALRS